MKHHPAALILIVAAVLFTAFPSLSPAEERFGPWAYYAPYYYPPDMVFAGRLFCPEDFAPRYESPNPPQPSNAVPPGMIGNQRPPVKVSRQGLHSGLNDTRGSGLGNWSPSTGQRPYQPARPYHTSPAGSVRQPDLRDTTRNRPAPTERPANLYVPREKPSPQLSTPGAGTNLQEITQPPATQRQTSERPAPSYQMPEKPRVQHTAPTVPDNAFKQLQRPAEHLETPEISSTPSSPAQKASTRSAPAEKRANEPVPVDQSYAGNASAKKPWTWGRPSSGNDVQPQQVAPYVPRPGDQRL